MKGASQILGSPCEDSEYRYPFAKASARGLVAKSSHGNPSSQKPTLQEFLHAKLSPALQRPTIEGTGELEGQIPARLGGLGVCGLQHGK